MVFCYFFVCFLIQSQVVFFFVFLKHPQFFWQCWYCNNSLFTPMFPCFLTAKNSIKEKNNERFCRETITHHQQAPRLSSRYEKLPETAKFIVLFRQPEAIFWTRYQRYCNSSWTGYAAVPAASISPELYASGMFAHMAGNEARWGF